MSDLLGLSDRLLRDPDALVSDDPGDLSRRAPGLLAVTCVGAAIWAWAVASGTGGLHAFYAPIKAPLLFLVPLGVCLPALRAFFDRDGDLGWSRLMLAGLVAAARMALAAAGMTPVVWLLMSLGVGYHLEVLLASASLGLASVPAWSWLMRRMPTHPGRWSAVLVTVLLLGATTAQTSWMLRPFILRPGVEPALLRSPEGDIFGALGATALNAAGVTVNWEPDRQGLVNRTWDAP